MGWMNAREGAASKWTCCSALLLTRDPTSHTSLGLPLPHCQEMGLGWSVLRPEPSPDLLAGGAWHGVHKRVPQPMLLGVGNFSRHAFEDRSAENSVSLLVPGLLAAPFTGLSSCSWNRLPFLPQSAAAVPLGMGRVTSSSAHPSTSREGWLRRADQALQPRPVCHLVRTLGIFTSACLCACSPPP